MSGGSIRYRALIAAASLAVFLPTASADPFPEGSHQALSWQGHPGPFREISYQGLDPVVEPNHSCDKARLIRGLETYPVGLPNGLEPDDLPNVWAFGSRVEPSEITGFPTLTLTGVAQPVTVIADMDFTANADVEFEGDMRVACVRCAFQTVELDEGPSGTPELWLLDSLVDADNGDPTVQPKMPSDAVALRPFEGIIHVLYSEVLGGTDSVRLVSGHDYFRNHIHGAQKTDSKHTDLMQGQSSADSVFIAENTLDGLFRITNATIFFGGTGSVYSKVDVVRNLIIGGRNGIRRRSDLAPMVNVLVWDNLLLADDMRVSWGLDGESGSFPVGGSGGPFTWGEGNTTTGGVTSGVDQEGRPWDLDSANVAPVPQTEKDRIAARIVTLETWAAELRAAVTPPECCRCDSDLDGIIGVPDLLVYVAEANGSCETGGPTTACDADCTGDGIVDIDDFDVLAAASDSVCGGCVHSVPVYLAPPVFPGAACSNGIDDDGDGNIDFVGSDLGCSHPGDSSESGPLLACDDGIDNDGDGFTDLSDPGCADACSGRESPACSNGLDDDGDGQADFGSDLGCDSESDISERAEPPTSLVCDDGLDNDGDGLADFPADFGCDDASDLDETSPSLVCDDGLDNDGDFAVDFPNDPGCEDTQDATEVDLLLICDNGLDDDADGTVDFPQDPGCSDGLDPSERDPTRPCDDGLDNDGDGNVDYPADSGCANPSWLTEMTACSDGLDNDGDGLVDFPADPDCTSASTLRELGFAAACANGIDDDGDGLVDSGADPGCDSGTDASERSAALVCDNGLDDDGDGRIDHPSDPGCGAPGAGSEIGSPGSAPQCDDGIDNDGDGWVDGADGGCDGPDDAAETTPYVACDDGVDNDSNGPIDFPADPGCTSVLDPTEGVVVDSDPPVVSPLLVVIEEEWATVAWTTDEPTQGSVAYGSSGGGGVAYSSEWNTHHVVLLEGLTCGTSYGIGVAANDAVGNFGLSPPGVPLDTLPCGSGQSLAGWWRFEEGSGTQAMDSSSAGATGTLLGTQWDPETADGSEFSLSFDGIDDLVDLGSLDLGSGSVTLSVWAKIRQFGNLERDGRFVSKADGVLDDDHYWMLATVEDGVETRLRSRLRTQGNVEVTVAQSGDVLTDQWLHAAVVYDGTEVRLFLDGIEVGRDDLSGALDVAPAVAAAAGNQPMGAGDRPLDGLLDDLRLYRRALTPVEIAGLYGGQAVISAAPTVATSFGGATIAFATDQGATVHVEYGLTPGFELGSSTGTFATTNHHVKLSGLEAETTYHYRVTATSESGSVTEHVGTFVTVLVPSIPVAPTVGLAFLAVLVMLTSLFAGRVGPRLRARGRSRA